MPDFQEDFKSLVEVNRGEKLSPFFKECLDTFEGSDQDFIRWFMKNFSNRHYNVVEPEYMIPLFEKQYQDWETELKFNTINES